MTAPAQSLRNLLDEPGLVVMPCCFDALSALLIEQAGFPLTFMSGFAISATRIGQPDTGLLSYGEVIEQGRNIVSAVSIPVIGDGDTGYGNALNVKRTVRGFARAGFAAVMIEDQVSPKRCGHTRGKAVVDRDEAFTRIRAAVDAREENGDILILARTDARATHGLDEAIERACRFGELGADILFVEAPQNEDEMLAVCEALPGPKMANMVEGGKSPLLAPAKLEQIGFKLAAYPLTLLSAATKAMQNTLNAMRAGRDPSDALLDFDDLKRVVGFDGYYEEERRYATAGEAGDDRTES